MAEESRTGRGGEKGLMNVAVLGLGPMGIGITHNLAEAGLHPTVWNRTDPRSKGIANSGVRAVDAVGDAAAATVLSVLPDVDQFRAVTGAEVWERWRREGTERVVVMSTTSPAKIRELERDLAPFSIAVADAAMSGGEAGAMAGTMSIMVGAHRQDWEIIEPLLKTIASVVLRFGLPGTGSVAKLCNQVVVAGTLGALAEALALAEHADIDRSALCDVFAGGLASSAVLTAKRERLLSREYTPSGSAVNQLKDLRYIGGLADDLGMALPLTGVLAELFTAVVDEGRGDEDHSVVLEQIRRARR